MLWLIIILLFIGFLYYEKIYSTTLQEYFVFNADAINKISITVDEHEHQKLTQLNITDNDKISKFIIELNKYPLKRKYFRETLYNLGCSITYKGKGQPYEDTCFFFKDQDSYIDIRIYYCKYLSVTILNEKDLESDHYEFELIDKTFDMKRIFMLQSKRFSNHE